MNNQCRVCKKDFPTEASLHKHIKAHQLYLAEYFQTYYPRFDKQDGRIILFKNKAQYLTSDFNTRQNLQTWIKTNERSTVRAYCKQILEERIGRKNLIWTPSQVELRTVMLPPIQCYNELFGSYYALCEELGLKNRFVVNGGVFRTVTPPDYTIYVDTREQLPLFFPTRPAEVKTLKFGDYACSSHELTCRCYIERKSAKDFFGTFSGGVERFCREMDKAVEAQAYMIVLVEDTLVNCQDMSRQCVKYEQHRKATPEFVFHNVRDIIQKYKNIQFLFVDGRERAAAMVEKIFDSDCSYKDVDLQFLYDTGKI
jgi:hypothetical protein